MRITQRGLIKKNIMEKNYFLSTDITYTKNVKWVSDSTCFSDFVFIYS